MPLIDANVFSIDKFNDIQINSEVPLIDFVELFFDKYQSKFKNIYLDRVSYLCKILLYVEANAKVYFI